MIPDKSLTFNNAMTAISMAVILFIGKTVWESSHELSAIKATMNYSQGHDANQDVALQELRIRITAVELDIAALKATRSRIEPLSAR